MRTDLSVRAYHRGEMRVDVHVRDQFLQMDYPPKVGGSATPLEVLLASLAACAANTLSLVLSGRWAQRSNRCKWKRGPNGAVSTTVLTAIELVYILRGEGLGAEMVERRCALRRTSCVRCWLCCGRVQRFVQSAGEVRAQGAKARSWGHWNSAALTSGAPANEAS